MSDMLYQLVSIIEWENVTLLMHQQHFLWHGLSLKNFYIKILWKRLVLQVNLLLNKFFKNATKHKLKRSLVENSLILQDIGILLIK
jgi:hypothetical protein